MTKVTATAALLVAISLGGCAAATNSPAAAVAHAAPVVPLVDHHAHLMSAAAARGSYPLPLEEVELPPDLSDLLAKRQKGWDDEAVLASLYTEDAVVLNSEDEDLPSWIRGRGEAVAYLARLFGRAHRIKPVAYKLDGSRAYIAGYFLRPEIGRHFGHVLLSLVRGADGLWRIEAETPTFPGPRTIGEYDAAALVARLDEAGVRRAVVLSVAYWFGSSFRSIEGEDEAALVRTENDWVAAQAARYPDRLVSFCSVNPLKAYARDEVRRCGTEKRHRGLKLHLGNSGVDLRKPDHAATVAGIVAEADRLRLPIIVHLWTDPGFEREGGAHARAFLDRVLPSAPNVVVQVAHMAGGGRATQPALAVFAQAIATGDPRTRNLIFDVATLADGETAAGLRQDVEQMRKIGLERIMFGSDSSAGNNSVRAWPALHALPLSEEEFRTIAGNIAPYLR